MTNPFDKPDYGPIDLLDIAVGELRDRPVPNFPNPAIQFPPESHSVATSKPAQFYHGRKFALKCRLAVSTVLVSAAVASILLLPNWTSTETVFAAMQNALRQAQSVSFTITTSNSQRPAKSIDRVMIWGDRVREERPGYVGIMDLKQRKSLSLSVVDARAVIKDNLPEPPDNIRNLLARLADPRKHSTKLEGTGDFREFNGKRLPGFAFKIDDDEFLIWIDPDTNLPLRLEQREVFQSGDESVGAGQKGLYVQKHVRTTVMDHFRFNEPMDESLFSLEPPEGYKVETITLPGE